MKSETPLVAEDIIQYIRALPDLFPGKARLTIHEIGNGNMNFVFRVGELGRPESVSVIVKHAPPYMRSVGSAWPLTVERLRLECEVLKIQQALCPGMVPMVYHFDHERSLLVMEDLASHTLLREGLIARQHYPQWPLHLGVFLARTLFLTSEFSLDACEVSAWKQKFANPALVKITSDFVFTFPFAPHEMNHFTPQLESQAQEMWANRLLQEEILALRVKFNTETHALIHGDLHTGSLMVTGGDTKVIDPEFAFYGPMGFDLGVLVANVFLNWCSLTTDTDHARDIAYREDLLKAVELMWFHFQREFRGLWNNQPRIRNTDSKEPEEVWVALLHDAVGFAGCEMIRRVVGTSHVEDLTRINDPAARTRSEALALKLGQCLILERHRLYEMSDVLALVADVAASTL